MADEPKSAPLNAAFLVGGFAVLTSVLTALGAATGSVDRVERNHTSLFWIGVIFVVVAVCLGALVQVSASPSYRCWAHTALAYLGAVLVGVGIVVVLVRFLGHYDWPWVVTVAVFIAIGVGLVVTAIGVFSAPAADAVDIKEAVLYRVGIGVFLAGLALVSLAVMLAAHDRTRPTIVVSLNETSSGRTLTIGIKADAVSDDEHLQVLVEGISPPHTRGNGSVGTGSGQSLIYIRAPLYEAIFGGGAAGSIDQTITLPVRGAFDSIETRAWIGEQADDCFRYGESERRAPGCVTIRVPPPPPAPQLTASFDGADTISVAVNASSLPTTVVDSDSGAPTPVLLSRPTMVAVRVYVQRHGVTRRRMLYSALLTPDDRGVIQAAISIAVPADAKTICAAALEVPPPTTSEIGRRNRRLPRCPAVGKPISSYIAWSRLRP